MLFSARARSLPLPHILLTLLNIVHFPLCVTGAVPVDAKAAELKFWTKNDGQVRIRFHFRQGTVYMNSSPSVGDCLS